MTIERITIEWYPINNLLIGLYAGHLYLVGRDNTQSNNAGYAISAHPSGKTEIGGGQVMGGDTIEVNRLEDLGYDPSWDANYGRLLNQTWDV